MLSILRHRMFRRLFAAQVVAVLGSGLAGERAGEVAAIVA